MLRPDKTDFAKWWYAFSSDRGIEHMKDFALRAYRAGVDAAQQLAEADAPPCQDCGTTMNKGYHCPHCGFGNRAGAA